MIVSIKDYQNTCITSNEFFETYYNSFAHTVLVWYGGCYRDYSSENDVCSVFYVKIGKDCLQVDSLIDPFNFLNRIITDNVADKVTFYGHYMRP